MTRVFKQLKYNSMILNMIQQITNNIFKPTVTPVAKEIAEAVAIMELEETISKMCYD